MFLFVVIFAAVASLSACGSDDPVAEPDRVAGFAIESTSFAPPPPVIPAPAVPTVAQLTALYNAALDYNVRVEDRTALFEGGSAELAQAFVQEKMRMEFTSVRDNGDGSVGAIGHVVYNGEPAPNEAGPIPFVSENGQWKISRQWACSIVGKC